MPRAATTSGANASSRLSGEMTIPCVRSCPAISVSVKACIRRGRPVSVAPAVPQAASRQCPACKTGPAQPPREGTGRIPWSHHGPNDVRNGPNVLGLAIQSIRSSKRGRPYFQTISSHCEPLCQITSETTSKSRPLTMDHTTENSPRKSPFQWQFSQNPIGVLSLIFFVGLRIFFGGCI